ncbi:HEAT repeat domain-containing protein [Alkalicoccus chagannorensis]|uniref:HEAT repeat domain-containing protein n=1 Tax=Alkalicoccus chagannorensis TaxID=427072 RepID=UPI0004210381|nr:HEAT repeat domain-containing protein [Alkalicoccus chagannorensis]
MFTSLTAAIWIVAGLAAVLTLIFTYLLINRGVESYRRRRSDAFMVSAAADVYQFMRHGGKPARSLIPNERWKMETMEKIFHSYRYHIQHEQLMQRMSMFAEWYMLDFYSKEMRSRKWSRRMNALSRIIEFRVSGLMDQVEERLQSDGVRSEEERLLMVRALLMMKEERGLMYLKDQKAEWSEFDYRRLLLDVEASSIDQMLLVFDTYTLPLQYALVDAIGVRQLTEHQAFLESLLESGSQEIRVRSLKSLHLLPVVYDPSVYIGFAESPLWEERLMTAKLAGRLPMELSLPLLRTMMHDSSWWVRIEAARALSSVHEGRNILDELRTSEEDRYCADAAVEALERRSDHVLAGVR